VHGGAEELHALDVGRLAPHVLGAHEDLAREGEPRAGDRGRDAVLAGAGLRDDAPLAHAQGQARLAERVVELVGAGVDQVLALQEDLGAPEETGQVLREGDRRRAAREGGEVARELRPEVRICARGGVCPLERVEWKTRSLISVSRPFKMAELLLKISSTKQNCASGSFPG
jgi:hypothetical protein